MKWLIFMFGMLCLSTCVMGGQEGDATGDPVLTGSVSDALSKKPVKGVTICVKSSKDCISKLVTTDEAGNFVFPKLPAGEVTIILEKKGYKTYRREKIVLKEGAQLRIDFDLSNEKKSEEVKLFHPLLRMMEL